PLGCSGAARNRARSGVVKEEGLTREPCALLDLPALLQQHRCLASVASRARMRCHMPQQHDLLLQCSQSAPQGILRALPESRDQSVGREGMTRMAAKPHRRFLANLQKGAVALRTREKRRDTKLQYIRRSAFV